MRDIRDIFVTLLRKRKRGEKKKEKKRREKERRRERNRESGESIIRCILRMNRSLDIRARHHVTIVRSALNEVYIIINITHLNMLITIINRAYGQDRAASSQVLNESDVWRCVMAKQRKISL